MELESSKRVGNLGVLTTYDLIIEIQNPLTTPVTLMELKTEFHSRVKNKLFQYCQRLCRRNRFDDSVAKDIFQNTLLKAFTKIGEFKMTSVAEEKISNSIAAWLNTIALNSYLDFLKTRVKTKYYDDLLDDFASDDFKADNFEFEENELTNVILQEAWDDLDDRERLIFYFCIQHNCLDNGNHLPDEAIDDICETLKITKNHLRTLKNRALRRLQSKFGKQKSN